MSNHELEAEITELQTKQAFQEDIIEQLSQALVRQQQQIEKLEFTLAHVVDKVKQLQPSSMASSEQEPPPPHY